MTVRTVQHVDVAGAKGVDPLALWSPVVGAETTSLLARSLSDDAARAQVSKQSASILSRCRGPKDTSGENRTGLVVGYVQSGKTLSFTALMAMARDNGFPLVILLAGTKKNLHEQTAGRLEKDLQVERAGGLSPWYLLNNPMAGHETGHVSSFIRDSLEGTIPEKFRRTTVITVMKNANRLTKLRELLTSMAQYGLTMDQVPVLVVDDEADQAGLNAAVSKDDETATYSAIIKPPGSTSSAQLRDVHRDAAGAAAGQPCRHAVPGLRDCPSAGPRVHRGPVLLRGPEVVLPKDAVDDRGECRS